MILDPYDYSTIQNAEPNIRGANLKALWKDTARFGNTETKRVYSWEEGIVGPLNALLNFAGARLRDLALTYYPFPEPVYYQVRVYPDKSTKVIPKSVVDNLSEDEAADDADKTYWKAGYPGNRYGPRILLAHPTLPSLDFVDMIRAHLVELCKQCFINSVPRTKAHRYIRLLIHRLRPYLDWVYTRGKTGKPDFNPESDQILREIVLEIRTIHGRHAGNRRSVTRELDDEKPPDTINDLKKQIVLHKTRSRDKKEKEMCQKILNEIDQGRIVDRDAEKLFEQVSSLIQQEGNYWHRILLSNLHHPASLKQMVYAGDKMLDSSVSVLVVGELPIERRSGQIDIVFSIRREIPGRTVMTPVMILEIKSKTGLGFNLYGVQTKNKKKKDYVPKFHAWRRRLTDDEWKSISNAKASKEVTDQLNAYEKKLLHEYKKLVPSDPTPPDSLWKGVVVLDTDQSPLEIYDAFQDLLIDLRMALVNDVVDSSTLTAYMPNPINHQTPPRLTLLLSPSDGPSDLISEAVPFTGPTVDENPFNERVSDKRILTLYVSIPSATSSGNAAAWISRNWHLLHHLRECEKTTTKKTEIIWLDLMGVFQEFEYEKDDEGEKHLLIRTRLGLDELLKQRRITRWTHKQLVNLVERISFVDLSHEIDQLVNNNNPYLSSLLEAMKAVSDTDSNSERIFIIDGWSEFRNLIPWESKHVVRYLERFLLDVLPEDNTSIIWIDSGVPHTRMNPHYQRKCVQPLPHDSHRKQHLDEILYNLPSSPNSFGMLTPRREDTRIIIQDTPTSAQPWVRTIDVPLLRNFTRIVRGARRRDGTVPEDEVVRSKKLEPMYNRGVTLSSIATSMSLETKEIIEEIEGDSMTLVSSVLRPRGDDESVKEEKVTKPKSQNTVIEKIVSPSISPTIKERMVLCPAEPPPIFSRNRYYDAKTITRVWYYDSFPSEPEERDGPVRKPPITVSTTSSVIDNQMSRELELRRLLFATEFLMRRTSEYENIYQVCEEIASICNDALKSKKSNESHLATLRDVRKVILKDSWMSTLWDELFPLRSEIIDLLNSENRNSLRESMERNPDVLELYGNNLFLTICGVVEELASIEHHSSAVRLLWSAVAEWIPYQLGFNTQRDAVQTKYDLQAIHSNLRHRTRILLAKSTPLQESVAEEWGQLIWMEEDGLYNVWIILRDEKEMMGGLLTNSFLSPVLHARWYECVKDSKVQRSTAKQAMGSINRTPLITQNHRERTILWMLTETIEEQGKVWMPFLLKHPEHQYRESNQLSWINLSEVSLQTLSELQLPTSTDPPSYVESNVDRFLESVIAKTGEPIRVTCHVSIDLEQELYQIDFYHNNEMVETQHYNETNQLVRTLRHPIRLGSGLETSDGSLLIWDHKCDVEYQDVSIERNGKKETISLTLLKPFVHRSRFYPEEYRIPKTCSELLSTEEGDSLTMMIQSEDSRFKNLKVELNGVPSDSSLRALETVSMNIFDVALLTECEQMIDVLTKTRHSLEIDVNGLFDLRFSRLSDYSRLHEAIARLKVEDYDWTKDSWTVYIDPHMQNKNEIRWCIKSVSGKVWQSQVFDHEMDFTLSIDEVISHFKETVSQTIPLKHLSGFSDVIAWLKRTLKSRGWRKGRPQCRVDLQMKGGEYVAVVSRLESEGRSSEITRFPIDVMIDEEILSQHLEGDWGPLSKFDVVNLEEFYQHVRTMTPEGMEEEDVLDEETEYQRRITKLENEPDMKFELGYTYVKLAQYRMECGDINRPVEDIRRAIELLQECNNSERVVVAWYLEALLTRCELIIEQDDTFVESDTFLLWKKEIQNMYDNLVEMSNVGSISSELRGRVLLLGEKE